MKISQGYRHIDFLFKTYIIYISSHTSTHWKGSSHSLCIFAIIRLSSWFPRLSCATLELAVLLLYIYEPLFHKYFFCLIANAPYYTYMYALHLFSHVQCTCSDKSTELRKKTLYTCDYNLHGHLYLFCSPYCVYWKLHICFACIHVNSYTYMLF